MLRPKAVGVGSTGKPLGYDRRATVNEVGSKATPAKAAVLLPWASAAERVVQAAISILESAGREP